MNDIQIRTAITLIIAFLFYEVGYKTDFFGLIKLEVSRRQKWIAEFEQWAFVGLTWLAVILIEKQKWVLWEAPNQNWYFYPLSVLGIFIGAVLVVLLLPIIFKWLKLPMKQEAIASTVNFYCIDKFLMVFGCITAGVIEELFYRAYLMPRLEILVNQRWLMLILSIFWFGIAHVSFKKFSLVGIVTPLLIGAIFAIHYYLFQNLIVLIVVHFLIDFASFITSCPTQKNNSVDKESEQKQEDLEVLQ